ncbi:helix-turn-helix transcriptional regulator [Steroidobacter flavus]|uniref:Helix-turn-helix transcriptional regulator n=1 Tax=Steroidobacter flavus TaxID=1842136 RepID=A0ABV8SY88_9GAMM
MNRTQNRGGRSSTIREESKDYFKKLGGHIAFVRKSKGYTQAELARMIGVSQQALFAYEIGERRVSVLMLEKLARALGVGLEELTRSPKPVRLRPQRLSPRAAWHAERLQALPKTPQRFVLRIIDVLEGAHATDKGR